MILPYAFTRRAKVLSAMSIYFFYTRHYINFRQYHMCYVDPKSNSKICVTKIGNKYGTTNTLDPGQHRKVGFVY